MNIAALTIDEVKDGLRKRSFSAIELAAEALRFAEIENPKTNAYLRLSPERALAAAARVDENWRATRMRARSAACPSR